MQLEDFDYRVNMNSSWLDQLQSVERTPNRPKNYITKNEKGGFEVLSKDELKGEKNISLSVNEIVTESINFIKQSADPQLINAIVTSTNKILQERVKKSNSLSRWVKRLAFVIVSIALPILLKAGKWMTITVATATFCYLVYEKAKFESELLNYSASLTSNGENRNNAIAKLNNILTNENAPREDISIRMKLNPKEESTFNKNINKIDQNDFKDVFMKEFKLIVEVDKNKSRFIDIKDAEENYKNFLSLFANTPWANKAHLISIDDIKSRIFNLFNKIYDKVDPIIACSNPLEILFNKEKPNEINIQIQGNCFLGKKIINLIDFKENITLIIDENKKVTLKNHETEFTYNSLKNEIINKQVENIIEDDKEEGCSLLLKAKDFKECILHFFKEPSQLSRISGEIIKEIEETSNSKNFDNSSNSIDQTIINYTSFDDKKSTITFNDNESKWGIVLKKIMENDFDCSLIENEFENFITYSITQTNKFEFTLLNSCNNEKIEKIEIKHLQVIEPYHDFKKFNNLVTMQFDYSLVIENEKYKVKDFKLKLEMADI